jgi:hypothetical protein
MYDTLKTFVILLTIVMVLWSYNFQQRKFSFFEKRDNNCLLPQVVKSILRWDKIKNELENRHKSFRAALYNKTRYTVKHY